MSVTTVGQPPASLPVATAPKPEPVNADGSAIPDEILYHHRPEDIGDLSNQDVPDKSENSSEFFGKDGLTFGDVLDIINPLQQIPVVSTVYRAITGDEISPGARVAGGALFGGPIGFAVATANTMVEAATGEDIGENVMTAMFGDSDGPVPEEKDQIAAAAPASAAKATTVAAADPATVGIPSPPISRLPQIRCCRPRPRRFCSNSRNCHSVASAPCLTFQTRHGRRIPSTRCCKRGRRSPWPARSPDWITRSTRSPQRHRHPFPLSARFWPTSSPRSPPKRRRRNRPMARKRSRNLSRRFRQRSCRSACSTRSIAMSV